MVMQGRAKSTLDTAKAAIVNLIELAQGKRFDSVLLEIFMKGVAQRQPAKKPVLEIWDPSTVLQMYQTDPPNSELSLLNLGRKAAMLTALASGQRCQTLAAISLDDLKRKDDCVCCFFGDRLKQTKGDRKTPVVHLSKYNNPQVCVYRCVCDYIDRTESIRNTRNLFIVSTNKHTQAASGTISSWLKFELGRAGIDIRVYSAHSARAAATSKAAESLSIDKVLEAADWANESTFAKYYQKQVTSHGQFMEAVWN